MIQKLTLCAGVLSLATAFATVAAPKEAESLVPPLDVSCDIFENETTDFVVSWSEVDGATKYASTLSCRVVDMDSGSQYGWIEVDTGLKKDECLEGECTKTVSENNILNAIDKGIEDGELAIDDEANVGVICSTKVKSLNPPGGRQNHKHSEVVMCSVPQIDEEACPAWTHEQLANIGTHAEIFPPYTLYDLSHYSIAEGLVQREGLQERAYVQSPSLVMEYSINTLAGVERNFITGKIIGKFQHISIDPDGDKEPHPFVGYKETNLSPEEYEACKTEILNRVEQLGIID